MWLWWETSTLNCVWCSTKTTFNVYVSHQSHIQFEDEDHAVYMRFCWVTTTCFRWEPKVVTLWLYPVIFCDQPMKTYHTEHGSPVLPGWFCRRRRRPLLPVVATAFPFRRDPTVQHVLLDVCQETHCLLRLQQYRNTWNLNLKYLQTALKSCCIKIRA